MARTKPGPAADNKMAAYLMREIKQAPLRAKFRLVREDIMGPATVLETLAEKVKPEEFQRALVDDLTTLTGWQTYRIYALDSADVTLSQHIIRARGSGMNGGEETGGLSNQMAGIVKAAFEQTGAQQMAVFEQSMRMLATSNDEATLLRAENHLLRDKVTALMVERAAQSGADDPVKLAQAEFIGKAAELLPAIPGAIKSLLPADKGSKTPKASPPKLAALREAAAKLSDDTLTKLVGKLLEHPEWALELGSVMSQEEKDALSPAVHAFTKDNG